MSLLLRHCSKHHQSHAPGGQPHSQLRQQQVPHAGGEVGGEEVEEERGVGEGEEEGGHQREEWLVEVCSVPQPEEGDGGCEVQLEEEEEGGREGRGVHWCKMVYYNVNHVTCTCM